MRNKLLLLEFYKELLPVFEKYDASFTVDIHGDATTSIHTYVNSDSTCEDDDFTKGQEITAWWLQRRIEELENEE